MKYIQLVILILMALSYAGTIQVSKLGAKKKPYLVSSIKNPLKPFSVNQYYERTSF